jgi:hypothetical protein
MRVFPPERASLVRGDKNDRRGVQSSLPFLQTEDLPMEENRFTFAGTVVTKPDQWTALLLTGHNFVRQGRLQDATKIF